MHLSDGGSYFSLCSFECRVLDGWAVKDRVECHEGEAWKQRRAYKHMQKNTGDTEHYWVTVKLSSVSVVHALGRAA